MKVEMIIPTVKLKSIIKSYTIIETDKPMETSVLPHFGLLLAIQFKGNVFLNKNDQNLTIPTLTISGMRKNSRKFSYEANTGVILILFTESGAFSFFGDSTFDLFGITEPLQNLIKPSLVNYLEEKITISHSNQERIRIIEGFLISNLNKSRADKLILAAITEIHSKKGLIRITDLSKEFNLSTDVFEKRFRKIVGASPKQFSTIVRMKPIIECQKNISSPTALAYNYEYYDQSHFIKQFKNLTGQTPRNFFKKSYNW